MSRKSWTLVVVCVATFMLLLDITIVNVALPKIGADLKASFSDIQWVIDAYALTLAALLLSAGTLADLLGRRRVFAIGLALFSLASLLCAVSPSALFLIIARGVQGIGGAIMFATSLALLAQEFHGRERGTAFGIWGATIGASAAVGPLLGGALTDGLGWSSIFFINVPVGLAAAFLTMTKLNESRDPGHRRIDWVGTMTFTAALFLLVLGLIRGNANGWGSPLIVGLFAGSVALLVAFVLAERFQEQPMFELSLFSKPTFNGASIVAFSLSAAMFAMFLYLTLYIQTLLGFSPFQTGLRFLPVTVVSFFVAAASGNLGTKVPMRFLLGAGLILVGVGELLMRGLQPGSHWTHLLAGFILAGAGIGLVNPTLAAVSIGVVPPERSGMASGINNTFRQVGTATGIAALGAVFESVITHHLTQNLAGTAVAAQSRGLAHAVAAGGTQRVLSGAPPSVRPELSHAITVSFVNAMNDILLVGGVIALVGAALAVVLVRARDFASYAAAQPAPAAAG